MERAARAHLVEPAETLDRYYARLLRDVGAQGWWPARTRLEVILGAILTQNTAWHNAALAVKSLRRAGLLNLKRLRRATLARLESSVRPAGFFRQKSRTIRNFLRWLGAAHHGSLRLMFARPASELRRELLQLNGLGPETADAILLYAGRQPYFVADAYTRRILARHKIVPARAGYSEVQRFLHRQLRPDGRLYNEFHALLVEVGKRYCKRRAPHCDRCPLQDFLPQRREVATLALAAG